MRLPNANRATVDIDRLQLYVLNPQHEEGKHKARVFHAVFELGAENASELRAELLSAVLVGDAVETGRDQYGRRFRVDFEMIRSGRRAVVRSAWFVPAAGGDPRLLSCWVLVKSVRDA